MVPRSSTSIPRAGADLAVGEAGHEPTRLVTDGEQCRCPEAAGLGDDHATNEDRATRRHGAGRRDGDVNGTGVGVGTGEAVGVGVGVGVAMELGVGDAVVSGVVEGAGVGVDVGSGDGLGATVGSSVGVGLGSGVGVGVGAGRTASSPASVAWTRYPAAPVPVLSRCPRGPTAATWSPVPGLAPPSASGPTITRTGPDPSSRNSPSPSAICAGASTTVPVIAIRRPSMGSVAPPVATAAASGARRRP